MILLAILLLALPGVVRADDAPAFCLPDLSREKICLDELIEKGPVVLDFWATWCAPCVRALPHLQALSEEFADRGVTVVGICADTPKTVSQLPQFVRGRKLTFTILLDTDNAVMRKYKIANLPYTCIIDTSGALVYSHLGYKPGDERELRSRLIDLLGVASGAAGAGSSAK
ncbi:MAG: TlpA family protein disulfide reductase [Candidatus Eisenbacteria bacterium]|jgi:peroxiredoxin|nr:TlpA family protein disulfide reductase [Candidatus Eisenbacteria bacterium]